MDIAALAGVGSGNTTDTVSKDQTGFAGLTANSFLKLLITQLQNQDPTEPVGNGELLNQLSSMRSLQSNIELGDALKSITVNQRLSTASTFIGKTVTGTTADRQEVTGTADSAFLRGDQAFVSVGESEIPLSSVTAVQLPPS